MPFLRNTTIRPATLIISNDISQQNISELLRDTWPDLQYLYWKSFRSGSSSPAAACAALAGDYTHPPACTQLRQFTVDIDANKSPTEMVFLVERMRTVVKKRRRLGVEGLENVKCVWSIRTNSDRAETNHLEWVNILQVHRC